MNESPPIPSPGPRGRSWVLRLVASTAAVFGLLWLCVVLLFPPPDLAKAARQADELQAIIRQKPEFLIVRVEYDANGKLSVFVLGELPPAARAELERLVAQHAPEPNTPIAYLTPAPEDAAPAQPK